MHIPTFTLLIVEDLATDRELYQRALNQDSSCNYQLLEAESVAAGLALCQTRSIDAILLDYMLPDGDGLAFLAALNTQSNGSSPPVVMISGQGNEQTVVRAIKLGAEDYLAKSDLTAELLQSTIRTAILQGRGYANENARLRLQLQQQAERFGTAIENMLDCFGIYSAIRDPAGQIVDFRLDYLNAAAMQSHWMTDADMGRTLCEVFPAHRETGLFAEYCQVVETGIPLVREDLAYTDAHGGEQLTRAYHVQTTKLDDGFMSSWRNITAQKQTELSLQAANRQMTTIWESMTDAYVTLDRDWRIVYTNPAAAQVIEQLTGLAPAEFLGKTHWEVFPWSVGTIAEQEYRRAVAEGVAVNFELFYQPTKTWFEIHAYPSAEGLGIYFRDIDERKRDEERLRQSEELTHRILESNRDCIKVVDLAGRLVYMNDYGQSLMEIDDFSTVANSQWLEFWQDSDRQSAQTAYSIAIAGGVGRFDGYCVTHKGTLKWWEVIVTPILGADGRVSEVLSVSRDITERQQAASLLQAQQATIAQQLGEIESIYQMAPIGLCFISNDLKFVRINEQLAEIDGASVAEHIGLTIRDVLPELADTVEPLHRQVIESGKPILDVELSGSTPSQPGVERHWLASYYPQTDVSGRVLGVNAIVQETTHRKRLEAARLAAEQDRDRFFTQSLDLLAIGNFEGYFERINPAFERLLGFSEAEFVSRPFIDFVHLDDRESTLAAAHSLANGQSVVDFENRCQCKDGSYVWVSWNATPYQQSNCWYGVGRDISLRKRQSAALLQSERKFSAIFNQTFQLMGLVSLDGVLLAANYAALKSVAVPESQIVGKSFWEAPWWHTEQLQQQLKDAIATAASGQFVRYEVEFPNPDGGVMMTDFSLKPMFNEVGQVESIVAEGHDITDRKQAQADLEQRNQELDSFVYIVSHDLKAPLRGIASLSEWIEEDLEGSLSVANQEQMTLLRSRVYKMEATIDGLLDYARSGSAIETIESVSISELLADVIDQIAPPPTFRIELPPELPTLSTRRLPLFQVFANLIGNGIKHHHSETGSIVVSIENRGDYYEFAVSDDGSGIAPEHHDRMFKIFQAVNPQNRSDSTGIGLAIVKKIVEAEGGRIWLESELGKGTTFYFTWLQR